MAKMIKTIIRGLFKLIYGRVNFDNNINYSTSVSEIDKYKMDVIINALDSDNLNLRSSWRENF